MRPILHRAMWSLQAAFYGRRPCSGPIGDESNTPFRSKNNKTMGANLARKFATAEFKGDWEFHVQLWQLRTYWRMNKICHLCSAARRSVHGRPYSMFGSAWPRRTMVQTIMECLPDCPCPLILCPGWSPEIIRFCCMHVLALGIHQTLNAESLLWLAEHEVFCSEPSADLDMHLRGAFLAFKKWQTDESVSCSGRMFTSKRLHVSSTDYPWLGYKAFNGRVVLAWTAAARPASKSKTSGYKK